MEGAFRLTNPLSRRPAGKLVLRVEWSNPLALPGEVKGKRLVRKRVDMEQLRYEGVPA